jgi:hypothetical protein
MNTKIIDALKEESTWLRLVFIILFAILLHITQAVIAAIVVTQFLSKLVTGKVINRGAVFGKNISAYVYEIIRFLTFATDDMPWPFAPWPNVRQPPESSGESADSKVAPVVKESPSNKPKRRASKNTSPKKASKKTD